MQRTSTKGARAAGAVLALVLGSVLGAGPGDEVAVVYNSRVAPDSRLVAEHYAQRRGVPAQNVIALNLPAEESITRAQFLELLQKPLLLELEGRKLLTLEAERPAETSDATTPALRRTVQARIRYLVLAYGVPLRILPDPALNEAGADKSPAEFRRNEAAVDSDLALLPRSEHRLTFNGPLRNAFYGATNAGLLHPTNGLLMVARLDGPSLAVAHGLVDRALKAEADGLWGRAYFDLRGLTNGAYKLGDDWLRAASEVARRQGFEIVTEETQATFPPGFPMPQVGLYAGWYTPHANGPFERPEVDFLPGAIAYHLHSYSATTVRSAARYWVGPLLAKGATATFGFVFEPYLQCTPDLGVFYSRLLAHKFTFGEAVYAAQTALSWQTTVVGDPLYRPFARSTQAWHDDLAQRHSPWLEWAELRQISQNLATGLPPADLMGHLEQLPLTPKSSVLEQKLAELYAAADRKADAVKAYRAALALKPAGQQRMALQMALAALLTRLDQPKEALALWERFLKDNPEYPEPLAVQRRILPLARQLGLEELAQKTEREIERLSPAPPAATTTNRP